MEISEKLLSEFLIKALDDDEGIKSDAVSTLYKMKLTPKIQDILNATETCESRTYLPKNHGLRGANNG